MRLRPELTRPKYVDPAFRWRRPNTGSLGKAKTFCGSAATFGGSKGLLDPRLEIPPVRQQVNPIEREQCNR